MLLFKVLINTYMWHALLVSDKIDQFDDDLLIKKLALDLRPPQRGATVTEGLRRRPVHKWSRPTGGRLKSRELCLTSTSNHSDPQVNPLCPPPPTNYILSSAYTPSCYRRPSKRTTSGLQTRNPWQTSRSTSLRSMTFKSTSSTKRLNDKPSLLVDPQMTSSHQWLWSIKVQQINKI